MKIFEFLPDYPDGTAGPVYNAGPGKENDKNGLTGNESRMAVISGTSAASYQSYLSKLEGAGYTKEAENEIERNLFCTLTKDGILLYLYYTANAGETRIIWDRSSTATLPKLSTPKTGTGATEFYQYSIDFTKATGQTWGGDYWQIDCGMNYIIKLADNSVFLIDGGHERQSSKAALEAYDEFLHRITNTPAGEKVAIVGWFFSHAHGDHVFFAHAFLEKYHESYDLRCVYYNIPSYHTIGGSYDSDTFRMKDTVNKYYPDVDHVKLHTGQTFGLQGVGIEVLFTHEDTVNDSGKSAIRDFNETTTVIRLNIGGKTFMMLGDAAAVAESTLCAMFSEAVLKSDAVQIAHHNYNNLPKLYSAIAADLLLVPNSKENSELSHNQVKIDAAIRAAADPVILYEGDDTYKITVENGQLQYTRMDRYTAGMEFTVPDFRYPADGPRTAERPLSDEILSGLVNLNDQIIDKSGFGTIGANSAEAPQRILDGNAASKWCVTAGAPAYAAWKMKIPVTVSAYQLFAGNDTEKFPQRSPRSWVLYGSADGVTWKVIDAVCDGGMSTVNCSASAYKVDSPAEYRYFALKFFACTSGDTMQISGIALYGNP